MTEQNYNETNQKENNNFYLANLKKVARHHAPYLGDLKSCVEHSLFEITSKSVESYLSEINEYAEPSEVYDTNRLLNEVEILNKGLDYLNGKENCIRPTAEQMKWGLDEGWDWKQVLKGYDVFDNSNDLDSKTGSHEKTITISRFDIMETFESDLAAAEQAEIDGIALIPVDSYKINPTDNANYFRFLDIPENHQFLSEKASEYNHDLEEAVNNVETTFNKNTFEELLYSENAINNESYSYGEILSMARDYINDLKNNNINYEKDRPNIVGKGYKVFWLKDGKLYPPMVQNANGKDTAVGEWLTAEVGKQTEPSKTGRPQVETGGEFAHANKGHVSLKPGFHISDLPEATQFNKTNPRTGIKELFPMELVWAEVEFSKVKNYQEEAHKNGINKNGNYVHALAGMNTVPLDGFYRYRTNPDPNTPEWNISGKMKVVRVLSRYEVDKILKDNGKEPPLHEEDFLQKQVQSLDKKINQSATVTINGKNYHCNGLLKGFADNFVEKESLKQQMQILEKKYNHACNLYTNEKNQNNKLKSIDSSIER